MACKSGAGAWSASRTERQGCTHTHVMPFASVPVFSSGGPRGRGCGSCRGRGVRARVCVCLRACLRACKCVRATACMLACVHGYLRACVRAFACCACVRMHACACRLMGDPRLCAYACKTPSETMARVCERASAASSWTRGRLSHSRLPIAWLDVPALLSYAP